MKVVYRLLFFLLLTVTLYSCSDIIEPSIGNKTVNLQAPFDQYQSKSYSVNFWWDQVPNALSYRLQVVSATFQSPAALVLDTLIKGYQFTYNFNPGNYQWRVRAENGSSQTAYATPRSFVVLQTSIKQQSVQLASPANNLVTNQAANLYQWGNLYGATKYRLEIDTNDFVNESAVLLNQLTPGQSLSFTFLKNQTYQWRVRAENDTAQSQWSQVNIITYDHTPPGQVTLVSPGNTQTVPLPVSLQWSATATAVKYKLYVFKSDSVSLYNTSFPLIINGTSYSFNTGNSGDKIYWNVTAIDAAGNESQAGRLRSFSLQ